MNELLSGARSSLSLEMRIEMGHHLCDLWEPKVKVTGVPGYCCTSSGQLPAPEEAAHPTSTIYPIKQFPASFLRHTNCSKLDRCTIVESSGDFFPFFFVKMNTTAKIIFQNSSFLGISRTVASNWEERPGSRLLCKSISSLSHVGGRTGVRSWGWVEELLGKAHRGFPCQTCFPASEAEQSSVEKALFYLPLCTEG